MGSIWGRAFAACGVLGAGVIGACSQGDPTPGLIPDTPPKEAGGTIVDAGGGDAPVSTCTGGDGGCNALENCGTQIYVNQIAQDAPAAAGGSVVDGTYVLTSYTAYTGTGGAVGQLNTWSRETMKLTTEPTDGGPADSGAVQQMVWLDTVATNASTTDSTSAGTAYFEASKSVEIDKTCPTTNTTPLVADYTVSGTQLLLFVQDTSSVGELTFTKQ